MSQQNICVGILLIEKKNAIIIEIKSYNEINRMGIAIVNYVNICD